MGVWQTVVLAGVLNEDSRAYPSSSIKRRTEQALLELLEPMYLLKMCDILTSMQLSNTPPRPHHLLTQPNGKISGISHAHQVLCSILALVQTFPPTTPEFPNIPPNFFGSHRLLSATNSVRSCCTSACFNWFFAYSSTYFW